jgi:HK97 family phage major capsid protein
MKLTMPTNAAELTEFLAQPENWPDEVKNSKDGLKSFLAEYGKQLVAKDEGIMQQVREEVQRGMVNFMKDYAGKGAETPRVDLSALGAPQIHGAMGRYQGYNPLGSFQIQKQSLYNKAAQNAKLDGAFDNTSNFFRALAQRQCGRRFRDADDLDNRMSKLADIQNSFATDQPSDGGFLVPEEFRSDLLMVALEHGIIRPRATVIPMSTQTLAIPAVDDTTHSGGTTFGGIQTYWVDESTQPTESSAKFAQVKLDSKKLMGYLSAPNELVADAPAFAAFLNASLPQALAFEEDYRFIQGNGSAQPLGFLNGTGVIAVAGDPGAGIPIDVTDLANMFARLLPSSMMNAIWVADIGTFPDLAVLTVPGAIGNSTPVWMNNGVIGAPPMSIYGRPVYFTEKCPSRGNQGDISLFDPSFYLIGDRQSMEASASPHFAFNVDKTAYKIIERVDGRPWLQGAITPRNAGNTISAYVALGARTAST